MDVKFGHRPSTVMLKEWPWASGPNKYELDFTIEALNTEFGLGCENIKAGHGCGTMHKLYKQLAQCPRGVCN